MEIETVWVWRARKRNVEAQIIWICLLSQPMNVDLLLHICMHMCFLIHRMRVHWAVCVNMCICLMYSIFRNFNSLGFREEFYSDSLYYICCVCWCFVPLFKIFLFDYILPKWCRRQRQNRTKKKKEMKEKDLLTVIKCDLVGMHGRTHLSHSMIRTTLWYTILLEKKNLKKTNKQTKKSWSNTWNMPRRSVKSDIIIIGFEILLHDTECLADNI